MEITEYQYQEAKRTVTEYERIQAIKGKTVCPFCGGSKTKPFISTFKSQDCTDCDKNGMIANKKLAEMGIEDLIVKT